MAPKNPNNHRTPAIERSLELLCDYLNFGTDFPTGAKGLVQHVLHSHYIQPFFDEYTRDYQFLQAEDIDLYDLQAWCLKHHAFHSRIYTSRRIPDKTGWTALHHAARFIVQVLRYSWKHDGAWSHGVWDPQSDGEDGESECEFWQVWLILRHLQAEWEAENRPEWSEESIEDGFQASAKL